MQPRCARYLGLVAVLGALAVPARANVVATFDDLPTPPALDSSTGLQFTNNNSLVYQGITWDSRFTVVGDEYRVNPPPAPPPNPLFGLPHSGDYFVTNGDGASGLTITTSQILTGAWFGQNEYYGFGGGADQITIVALAGAVELASVVFDLPENNAGQPEPLSFVDTSSFVGLAGITGYRIDRRAPNQFAVNWVADDFQFQAAAVPEPASIALVASALPIALLAWRRRRPR